MTIRARALGGIVLRLSLLLAVLAIVFAYFWMPFSSHRRPSITVDQQLIDSAEAQSANILAWPERRGEHPAPPLVLWIRRTDSQEWYPTARQRSVRSRVIAQNRVVLEVTWPTTDTPLYPSPKPLCNEGEASIACAMSIALMTIERDYTNWDRFQEVLSKAEVPQTSKQQKLVSRDLSFWTKTDSRGSRSSFQGWACDPYEIEAFSLSASLSGKSTVKACFNFVHFWEKLFPGLFGYRKHKTVFYCANGCSTYFLFNDRLIELNASREGRPVQELIVAAWEMLNREAADAVDPPKPDAELLEAQVQLHSCEAIANAIQLLKRHNPGTVVPNYQPVVYLASCGRTIDIASRATKLYPKEATPLLIKVIDLKEREEGRITSDTLPLYQALLLGLRELGASQSAARTRYLGNFLEFFSHSVELSREERDQVWPLLPDARELSLSEQGESSEEDLERVREGLAEILKHGHRLDDAIAFLKAWIAVAEKEKGKLDRSLLKPYSLLVADLLETQDSPALWAELERFHTVWFAQPEAPINEENADEINEQYARSGYKLLQFFGIYALRERQGPNIRPILDEIVARTRSRFGATNSWTQELSKLHMGFVSRL